MSDLHKQSEMNRDERPPAVGNKNSPIDETNSDQIPIAANLGWKYYVEYFKALSVKKEKGDWESFFKTVNIDGKPTNAALVINKEIQDARFSAYSSANYDFLKAEHCFTLTTAYPGLLIGSGYQHETGAEGEFKIGFFFDWTTGIPVIPGSSVKGVIRSVFNRKDFIIAICQLVLDDTNPGAFFHNEHEKAEFTTAYSTINSIRWIDLENEIFGNPNGKEPNLKGSDIFHDAVISKASGKFLAADFITHHPSPLQSPNPVMFLKVLPKVTFRFQFELTDGILSATAKRILFQKIIMLLGVGAKTNVGYGHMI